MLIQVTGNYHADRNAAIQHHALPAGGKLVKKEALYTAILVRNEAAQIFPEHLLDQAYEA